ncbi:MAG: hypothetical protein LUC47_07730 [Clostridiales bacterium]|nr:hypothetical protein [Clostridiales bacterium]
MTLSDNLHLGDRVQLAPSWEHGEHNSRPAVQLATVIYIHPEGRYCTVRYRDGLTDTIQTVPAERVASPFRELTPNRPNKYVRDRLKGLHVTNAEISAAFGHKKSWIGNRLDSELTREEREEIIQAAERIAANKKRP